MAEVAALRRGDANDEEESEMFDDVIRRLVVERVRDDEDTVLDGSLSLTMNCLYASAASCAQAGLVMLRLRQVNSSCFRLMKPSSYANAGMSVARSPYTNSSSFRVLVVCGEIGL